MADTERSAIPVTQALTVGDRAFIGMDTYTDSNKLQDGFCQRITNLVSKNGSLVPRKGFQRITTTARNGSYYAATTVRSSTNVGQTSILVAESNALLHAGFWKFDQSTANAIPIPMSASGTLTFANINPSKVRMTQLGRYVYVAPGKANSGSDSFPLRIDTNTRSSIRTNVSVTANKMTVANNAFVVGDPIYILSVQSGTLPGALSVGSIYYVSRVVGNDFYLSSTLPTTTNTTVSHLTWSAPSPACSITVVTTFKGETVPVAVGLPDIAPVPEAWPFVAKAIPTSNVYSLTDTNVTLSSSAQMLSNSTFTGNNNDDPASWTQFTSTKTVTVKDTAGIPTALVGKLILIDDSSENGVYPGVWQSVTPVTETTTLYNGSVTTPCLMYRLSVRLCHYDQATTPRRRPVTIRVKATKLSGAVQVDINGAIVEEYVNLEPNNKNKDGFTVVDVIADFRDFKDEITTSGKIRVEIQAAADFGLTGAGQEGLYVDYMYLYPHVGIVGDSTTDTAVDNDVKLVRMRATSVNTNTLDYAGYIRDRYFYYNVTSSPTVNFTLSSTSITLASGTMPSNGTPVSFSNVGSTNLTANQTYFVVNAGTTTFSLSATYNGSALTIGGTSSDLTGKTMTTGLYLKNAEYLSLQFYLPPTFDTQQPSFSIGIQSGTMTSIVWGGKGAVDPVNRYLTFDLSVFQKSDLENVKAVYVRSNNDFFVSNLPDAAVVTNNTIVFYVGQLVYNGELQNQGTYEYAFTRWKAAPAYDTTTNTAQIRFNAIAPWTLSGTTSSYFGGVESPLSKTSVPLRTSNAESRIRLTISASDFKDSADAGYTHLMIYRRNNTTFPDGKFRCVAQVNISGATPTLASSSSGIILETASTTATNIVLIDNVGDTELLFDKPLGQTGYIFRDGKDFFPQGMETIAVHQQRLWMSKGNSIYASWLIDNDNEYALHTTIVPIAGDSYLPIKGASFDISTQFDYEPIVAMVPFSGEGLTKNNSTSNALLVLKNNSILPITGSDASTFSVLGFVREAGAGCIAPLNARTYMGHVWWLSSTGINQYANGLPIKVSKSLDRLVNATTSNAETFYGLDMSYQVRSCSVVFDNKFIFTSSQPNNGLTTLFVFDPNIAGWYEWQFPQSAEGPDIEPASMFVFDSEADVPILFVAASNGHIYQYQNSEDMIETTATPFTWAVLTRQYGQTYAQGQAYYAQNRVSQLDIHLQTQSSLTVNWKIYNQDQDFLTSPVFNPLGTSINASGTWTFPAGNKSVGIRNIIRDLRGTTYSVELSGSSLSSDQYFRIFGILLHVNEGGIRRIS